MSQLPEPQAFADFRRSIETTTLDELRAIPDTAVESAAALEEMRAYLLDQYDGVTVERSFADDAGRTVDLVAREYHPAVKKSGEGGVVEAPAAPPAPEAGGYAALHETAEPRDVSRRRSGLGHDDQSRDDSLRTLPLERVSLEQLARFGSLAAMSQKDGSAAFELAAGARAGLPTGKHYATGEQDIACLGGSSVLNVWKYFVSPSLQATFSQQWYAAGLSGTRMQTVECGWHIDYTRYADLEPHLFIFTTRDTYKTADNRYNLDGNVFVPAANPIVSPGAPLSSISTSGGSQYDYQMGFYLVDGNWWFYFGGVPVGYYPLAWFGGGALTTGATRAKFGGEVGTGIPNLWPPMGSGAHASAGFGKAAYHHNATVYPAAGGAVDALLSEAGSTNGPCYTIDIANQTPSTWGTFLYFGGPGGSAC
jgi:Neprosin